MIRLRNLTMSESLKPTALLLSLAALVIQSCITAREYTRPEVETQAAFRADSLKADSVSLATLPWNDLFRDEHLQGYIQRGLENNPDIQIALQNILIAEQYLKQGKAGYYPSLSATAGFTRTKNSPNSQFGSLFSEPIEQFQLSGSLSWEADIWGKIRSTKRAAQATYLQSTAAHQAIRTRLIASLATTYYQLLALDKQESIAVLTFDSRKNSLETIQALKAAGQVTEVAVKGAEAQVYATEIILIDLRKNIRLLENSFCLLLGEAPHAIVRGTMDAQELNQGLRTGVPSQLLSNRPDVMQSEFALVNAFELTNVARASLYPTLSLGANGGFQSLEAATWLSTSSLFSQLLASLTQPLLNGRQLKTRLKVSEARQQQALLDFRKAMLTAGREVSDALYEFNAQAEIAEARRHELEALSLAEAFSEELLNFGLADYLEVLTARQNALNTELRLVDAQYGQLSALVELYRALGGGWQ